LRRIALKKFLFAVFAIVLSISLCSCRTIGTEPEVSSEEIKDYPVAVGQLEFEKAPEKVVSLSPALTEIICDLGYSSKIIGRSSYCDYPEEIKSLPDAGSSANPDIETIIKLSPELLVSQSPIAKKDISKLENAGIRVLITETPNSVDGLYDCYKQFAALFGGESKSAEAADKAFEPLSAALENLPDVGSFAYIMTADLAVSTGDTLSGDVLSRFGENVAKGSQKYNITAEELISSNPKMIFIASPLTAINLPQEISGLEAISGGKVVSVDNTCFERPTARLIAKEIESIKTQLSAMGINAPAQTAPETAASVSETTSVSK